MLEKGLETPLEMADLYSLDADNQAEKISRDFEDAWKASIKNLDYTPQLMVLRAAVSAFGRDYLISALFLFLYNTIQLICPIVIHYLLVWLESPTEIWIPYLLVVILLILQLGAVLSYNLQFELAAKTGFRLRTGLSMTLYRKYFKLSNSARQEFSVGKIVNISSTDTLKIDLASQVIEIVPS